MNSSETEQTIWLCRHGNRIDFVDPSWTGDDPHLSEDGVRQAKETGERLRGERIQHIFASPFLRTVETASHIADALNLKVKIEAGASEWLNSEWFPSRPELIPPNEMVKRFACVDPNHESLVIPEFPEDADQASQRAGKAACMLADAHDGDILIIGHGHSVCGMAYGLMGGNCEISPGLCSLVKIVRQNGSARVELKGDGSHLSAGDEHRDRFN